MNLEDKILSTILQGVHMYNTLDENFMALASYDVRGNVWMSLYRVLGAPSYSNVVLKLKEYEFEN